MIRRLCVGLVALVLVGCGSDKPVKVVTPVDGLPAGTPANDSPLHLLARYDATFEAQSDVEYAKLLTDDFRFRFSADTDPLLVSIYGDGWPRTDEQISITHLFRGFTNTEGSHIPAASRIEMVLNAIQVADDTSHVDSVLYYRKLVVTSMDMTLEVPGAYEPTIYQISSRQEFYVVRGDAAVLPAGQPAQADRWYIRRWDDLSVSHAAAKGPVTNPAQPKTIGSVKHQYR